ncbi:hypothetical protein KRR38_19765 [Novosphingobium sp. G106]|uniref:DUF3617 domain-containing protein n=1 Tax=Novosphingobium sp. G106 TaxID=2849500 RepID=UPI001C2DD1F5|nr:hypothetical protein [Novosphingobium sp. G106]MBV1689858.1 hypothetical protein [Novosphingobium sp. G106]
MTSRIRLAMAMAGLLVAFSAPAAGQRPALAMLNELDAGRWELRVRDDGSVERLCLPNVKRLIQLRHPADACERLIVTDADSEVTVQYTCRGRGYGRTHIRRETSRLIQLDTQGIADGLPFAFAAEARRVGDCAT